MKRGVSSVVAHEQPLEQHAERARVPELMTYVRDDELTSTRMR